MALADRVRGKTVLEIGCNSGFLSVAIARSAAAIVGFDINPHLISIAEAAATHAGISQCVFKTSTFESFEAEEPFDCVLSFANHSTHDGNTKQSLENYFEKCWVLTRPGGRLLFESHPPAHEGDGLKRVLEILERRFSIQHQEVLTYGTFLDTGRTFVVADRREQPQQP
jgi:2-polyprenyl-3-methyl-5-hydroxy-6-metoxy-1,4-benzoquinol methylase